MERRFILDMATSLSFSISYYPTVECLQPYFFCHSVTTGILVPANFHSLVCWHRGRAGEEGARDAFITMAREARDSVGLDCSITGFIVILSAML